MLPAGHVALVIGDGDHTTTRAGGLLLAALPFVDGVGLGAGRAPAGLGTVVVAGAGPVRRVLAAAVTLGHGRTLAVEVIGRLDGDRQAQAGPGPALDHESGALVVAVERTRDQVEAEVDQLGQ